MELKPADEETMVRIAVSNLSNRFTTVDHQDIETRVRRQVAQWCRRARVKTFVGLIAERHARDELQHLVQPAA